MSMTIKGMSLREQTAARLGTEIVSEDAAAILYSAEFVECGTRDTGWSEMPITDLCAHIVSQHHGYLRQALPRITHATAHLAGHPAMAALRDVFAGFRMDLEGHMAKEEATFFPQMCRLERETGGTGLAPSVAGPIRFLEAEHDEAMASLTVMRGMTSGFTPDSGASPTMQLLLAELAILDEDMRWHVHKENDILFPRAAALERARTVEVW